MMNWITLSVLCIFLAQYAQGNAEKKARVDMDLITGKLSLDQGYQVDAVAWGRFYNKVNETGLVYKLHMLLKLYRVLFHTVLS